MRWAVLVIAAGCSLGCSLGPKVKPLEVRYFSPEAVREAPSPTPPACARVRLGRITSSAHLRYKIVHRESAVELGRYETLRWTEQPETYVQRSLAHALFERHPLEQEVGVAAPTLEIQVLAFEEVARGDRHAGRVELRYRLHDGERVLARGDLERERSAAGQAIERVVPAIGAALEDVSRELADRVTAELCP